MLSQAIMKDRTEWRIPQQSEFSHGKLQSRKEQEELQKQLANPQLLGAEREITIIITPRNL